MVLHQNLQSPSSRDTHLPSCGRLIPTTPEASIQGVVTNAVIGIPPRLPPELIQSALVQETQSSSAARGSVEASLAGLCSTSATPTGILVPRDSSPCQESASATLFSVPFRYSNVKSYCCNSMTQRAGRPDGSCKRINHFRATWSVIAVK